MATAAVIASRSMVKLVALYGPPTEPAAFEQDYRATHMPLVAAIPGLMRVETARILGTLDGGAAPYCRTAEL